MSRKHVKSITYSGFGYVNFPVDGFDDAKLGIATVRVISVDMYGSSKRTPRTSDISFDDVLVGTSIHQDSQDAFTYLTSAKDCITGSRLLGSIDWVGSGTHFWTCTYSDLDSYGKKLYDRFYEEHIGEQVFLSTCVCNSKVTVKSLTEEIEREKLLKRSYLKRTLNPRSAHD